MRMTPMIGKRLPAAIGIAMVYWITLRQISRVGQITTTTTTTFADPIDSDSDPHPLSHHPLEKTSITIDSNTAITNSIQKEQRLQQNHPTTTSNDTAHQNIIIYQYHKIHLQPDETFMWKGRQKNLCKRIRKERSKFPQIEEEQESDHSNTTTTTTTSTANHTIHQHRMVLYFGVPCEALHQQNRHGNLALGLYAMHVAAMAHNADLIFACQKENDYSNLFWWLQSLPNSIDYKRRLLSSPTTTTTTPSDGDGRSTSNATPISRPSPDEACKGMGKIPLQYATNLATYDLRRMALALFGPRTSVAMHQFLQDSPEPTTTTTSTASSSSKHDTLPTEPLFPDMELDSIAIHFRCGDVLSNLDATQNGNYGFVPFSVYRSVLADMILDETTTATSTTIGIITAPFDPHHLRRQDAQHATKCQILVETLRDYLESHFPSTSKVSIRNDPSETIPMVLSRLILADQVSICIRSTFCVFPTLASFAKKRVFLEGGVSYFVSSSSISTSKNNHQNQRSGESAPPNEDYYYGNELHLLDSKQTPYLYSHDIQTLGWNASLEWLLTTESSTTSY